MLALDLDGRRYEPIAYVPQQHVMIPARGSSCVTFSVVPFAWSGPIDLELRFSIDGKPQAAWRFPIRTNHQAPPPEPPRWQ